MDSDSLLLIITTDNYIRLPLFSSFNLLFMIVVWPSRGESLVGLVRGDRCGMVGRHVVGVE